MTRDEYLAAWSGLHGGHVPAGVVRGWLLGAYRIGSWLAARRVSPAAVTVAGLLLCLGVPVAAWTGGPGLLAGAALILLASVADALDGAVAVLTGRVSRIGFVYDSVADRLGELSWLLAFWVVGAPGPLVVAAGAASWLHEYVRARAAVAGMPEIGAVTVAERPTRVIVGVAGLILTAAAGVAATGAMAVWLVLQVVGIAQLGVAVRSALR